MREIKFRAWDKKNKIMIKNALWLFMDNYTNPFEDKDYITMQYTGLKDKNGKEIYEGDILHIVFEKCDEFHPLECYTEEYIGYVFWDEMFSSFYFKCPHEMTIPLYKALSTKNFEVIGNIYENPELINGLKRDEKG